ncbi:PREDICTED: serpin B4-like [Diuraphis noxia]|uniref:serpin B4-like n=1 Tax=Diuraphis noxia TaxID=143948 RepID=UPI0007639417|nr:PREDICTED: serpin B4-like [Diuraphis noxia]
MEFTTNLEELISAYHEFSFSLYKEIAKTETGNIFYSPFGIHMIMFMTSTGAASKTFDEIVATMHLNKTTHSMNTYRKLLEDITNKDDYLTLANGMFVDTSFNVKDSFVENSMKYLKSSMEKLEIKKNPEQQCQYLNDWVSSKTNSKIKNLFPKGSINKDTALVLANAVHFKSAWAHQFQYTYDDSFYVTPINQVTVKMMYLEHDLQYYHDSVLKFSVLELPYKNHDFKMVILLPDAKDGLEILENNFSKINLHDISNKMTQQYILVKLPRFKLEQSLQLDETLSNLGCPTMFTLAANFSNIVDDNDLYVSKIVHKAYIKVDETGTEAAAATGFTCCDGFSSRLTVFIADHPFIFFISTRCNKIIFVGRMTNID